MDDLKATRISITIHTAVAVVAGLISFQLPRALLGAAAGIAILLATGFAAEKIVRKKGIKWWASNGLVIYVFFWFITWAYLVNTA